MEDKTLKLQRLILYTQVELIVSKSIALYLLYQINYKAFEGECSNVYQHKDGLMTIIHAHVAHVRQEDARYRVGLQEWAAAVVGLLGYTINYIFRKDAYHQSYSHLEPSSKQTELRSRARIDLGCECFFVAFLASLVAYMLIILLYRKPRAR
jgi:hypothetical protein